MHFDIKRFGMSGTVNYEKFNAARESMLKEVEDSMRDEGCVPVLDLLNVFSRSYNEEDETFDFEISMYGTYVGEDEAWQIAGKTIHGTTVMRSTVPAK